MQKGFMYLFIIIDWYSRMIVDYELSSTLEKSFVLACLNRALAKRRPQIINSDGSVKNFAHICGWGPALGSDSFRHRIG